MKNFGIKSATCLLAGALICCFSAVQSACAQEGTTIHVATNGVDANDGTAGAPVATVEKAIKLAERQPVPCEIIVHGGTYFLEKAVTIKHCPANKDRKLVIRSADNETAIFDGSIVIDKAEPLDGAPGVYTVKGDFPTDQAPEIWEGGTNNIIFSKLASLVAVKYKDYSCVVLDPQTLALKYKDGLSPANRDVRIGRVDYGFLIFRDNVTVKWIEFRNFCRNIASGAVMIGVGGKIEHKTAKRESVMTTNTVIDSCSSYNCRKGFWVYTGSKNALITHCRVRNAVTGMWISGVDAVVEHCTIVNDPGRIFLLKNISSAENSGIRMYNASMNVRVCFNFIKGFRVGIHCKNGYGTYVIENNTVLYGQPDFEEGFFVCAMRPNMSKDYHVRYNIFAGFAAPFIDSGVIPADADIDYNVFWGPEHNFAGPIKAFQKKGVGLHNVVADPFFASPYQDDYRLLPGSPAIHGGEKRAGAFPMVAVDYKGVPNLRATLADKKDIQTRDPFPPPQLPPFASYLSRQRDIAVNLAVASIASVKKTRFRINDGPMQEKNFKPSDIFDLPDKDGLHTVYFQVQDVNGSWSRESVIYVNLNRGKIQLIGEPKIMTNQYGALFSFKTDCGAWGKLEYNDSGKWVETANSGFCTEPGFPQKYHEISVLPLSVTGLPPGTPHQSRLTISTPLNSTVREVTFILSGEPKIMYVSTMGEDSESGGTRAKPFKTIQFALDRALPGDRVRIMPGVYFGSQILNHGGTKEHPLVIEGLYPNTVTLDALQQEAYGMLVQNAPHVILRNLNVQWVISTGISISASEGVRVTGCRFQNQYWRVSARSNGTGLSISGSPNFIVDHCIFSRFHYAGLVIEGSSGGGKILHNTAMACETALVQWSSWHGPSDTMTIQYNSLHYNGDQLLSIQQPLDILRNRCVIDYNNYGTTFKREEGILAGNNEKYGRSVPKPFPYLPSNRELQYYRDTTDLSNEVTHVFVNMEDWLEFSGQDKHSIFADPKWIDPRAGRFDVAADSPNLLPDGKIIGALGYLGENPNMEPEAVITTPYSGEELKETISVSADASDYDGSIKKVEFYADSKLIGEAASSPYTLKKIKLVPGAHSLTAKAIDNRGGVTESDVVNISVR